MQSNMSSGIVASTLKQIKDKSLIDFNNILTHILSSPEFDRYRNNEEIVALVARIIAKASEVRAESDHSIVQNLNVSSNVQTAKYFDSVYSGLDLPPLQTASSFVARPPSVLLQKKPEASSEHITRPRRRPSDLWHSLQSKIEKLASLNSINTHDIKQLFPEARESTDHRYIQVADIAHHVFPVLQMIDALLSTHGSSLTGTGAFGTTSSAQVRGYHRVFQVLINALLNGFTIQEAQILSVGMFIHGSDIFYLVAKVYRRFQTPSMLQDPQVTENMRKVHEIAFEILQSKYEQAGTIASEEPRLRAIGLDMLETFQGRGPWAKDMVANMRSEFGLEIHSGTFGDQSTLCTGEELGGCYSAFKATANYDIPQNGYGLIILCNTLTYNYSKFSPFPQESEWVVPPGRRFKTLVFSREVSETRFVKFFFDRIDWYLNNYMPPDIGSDILLKGLKFLTDQQSRAQDACDSIKYLIFMYP